MAEWYESTDSVFCLQGHMMAIALLSQTLQTVVMGKLSLTRPATIQIAPTRG